MRSYSEDRGCTLVEQINVCSGASGSAHFLIDHPADSFYNCRMNGGTRQ